MAEKSTESSGTAVPKGLTPWPPGQSGNPGGRRPLPDAFKERGPEALERLVEFMTDDDSRIALRATEVVVERIYGKPAQPLEHEAGAEMLDILAERLQKRLADDSKE